MPLTDQEKELQVHSCPSTDFLAAVPIKKRRFLFHRSPSPPPDLSSPALGDCSIHENKPESPNFGLSSKSDGSSTQVNNLTGKIASSESRDQAIDPPSLTPAISGTFKEKVDASEHVATLIIGDQVGSFSNEAPSDCHTSETKSDPSNPVSSLSVNEKINVQIDVAKGQVSSGEDSELSLTLANCIRPEMKHETPEPAFPFSETGGILGKVNAVTGESCCEPSLFPSSTTTNCEIHESSKPEFSISETIGDPAQLDSVTGKDGLIEPHDKPKTSDLNIVLKHEMLPNFNDQGSGFYLGANPIAGTGETVLSNKSATSLVTGSMVISSPTKQTFEVPGGQGSSEDRFTHREGIPVRKEELELKKTEGESGTAKFKADPDILCLNRSNWDLNTMMDTWLDSSVDSSLNKETADQGGRVLGGIQQLGQKQILFKEPIRTDIILGNNRQQKVDSNPEASLELQLKPPSICISLGKHEAIGDKSFLSLATEPMVSAMSALLGIGATVKSEPKVQLGLLKSLSLDLKNVKSEPCEGREISKTTICGNFKLACNRSVKPEPCEDQSQVNVKNPEDVEQKSPPTKSTLFHQNAGKDNNKASDMASEPLVLNTLLRPCTDFSNDSSSIVDKVKQVPVSVDCLSICTTITQATDDTATESSDLRSRSLISSGNDVNLPPEPCEKSCLPLPSLPEPLTSNTPETDFEFSFASQKEPSNVHHSSDTSSKEDILRNPCVNSEVIVSNEVADKVGPSSEVTEEHCNYTSKSANLHVSGESMNTIPKQGGKSDEDFEDGEVRDSALKKTVQGSCDLAEGELAKASDSISPVDVPVSMPLLADEKEIKLESTKRENICCSNENEEKLLYEKVESCSSDVGVPTTAFCEKSLSKNIDKAPEDHLKNDECLEQEIKSSDQSSVKKLANSQFDAAGNQQQNSEGPKLAKDHVSGNTEPSNKGSVTKDANDRGNNRRIIYLNSASNCSTSGKRKSTLDRSMSMSSQGERHRTVHRSFRVERSRSRGSRDESRNERPQRFENGRNYGRPLEQCRSDNMHGRNRANRLNALRGDRNSNVDQLPEQMNNSTALRYSRPISNSEVAIDSSLDGSGRLRRKLTSEEMEDQSHLPCQRRSFEGRRQMPLVHHSIGREAPDFAFSNQRSQFERAEGIIMHRERRSLSPTLRRGGPQSSLGSQQKRPSDGFHRPRELIQHRSPPIMRLNRRQSPQERHCFPEEGIGRRRGSPPYDMVDVGPPREEFPRNTRRFNMIDSQEVNEGEEYFDLREFGVDDRFVENRRCIDSRGPIHSFAQRCVDNDESESFRFHGEPPPPRVLRLRPDASDGFIEGSRSSREFDVLFKKRLGNSSSKLRGIVEEQEDNYRHHRAQQEWCDAGFNDARPKRRRF